MMVNILKIVILNTSNAWHVPLIWQTWVSHREQHGDEKYSRWKRMTIVIFGCQEYTDAFIESYCHLNHFMLVALQLNCKLVKLLEPQFMLCGSGYWTR